MKYISLLLIILVILPVTLKAQALEELEKRIASENGIRSKTRLDYKYSDGKMAKSGIKTSLTTYNRAGDVLQEDYLNEKGVVTGSEKYDYDANGNRTLYERNGNSKYKKQTQYNSQNQIMLEAGFNGSENFRNEYSYSGGKVSEIVYTLGSKVQQKLKYSWSGNTAQVSVYTGGNSLSLKIKMVYDARGNLVEETTYTTAGKELEKKEYRYDSYSRLLEEVKTKNGKFYYRITNTYSPRGNLQEVAEETLSKKRYAKKVYVYDDQGNLFQYKWRRNPDEEFNVKSYTYDSKGICLTEHTLYPATHFELLSKYEYEFY
jgi:hypothetical protein